VSDCDCGCARELDRLQDEVRTLEHQLAGLRYDLEREIDDRRSAIRSSATKWGPSHDHHQRRRQPGTYRRARRWSGPVLE